MRKLDIERAIKPYLLEEKADEKSVNTLKHYEHVISLFVDSLKYDEVSKFDIINFKSLLVEKYSPKTVNNYIIIINKFIKYIEFVDKDDFEFYKLRNYRGVNTLKNIKLQKKSSLENVLEPEDLKRMLRVAKKYDYEMYLVMRIFAFTGIRAEELKFFTVEAIKSNYIQVTNKGKIRDIILVNALKNELQKYCESNHIESGFVFRGKKEGTMLHKTTVYKRLKKVAGRCRGIDLEKVHPHSFRHLFAVKFIQDGGDISELADILGHGSIETTRIYTRTTNKMKKKRLEKMRY